MKTPFLALLLMVAPALFAAATGDAKALLNNGDFEKSGGWKGDGRIGKIEANSENKSYILQLGPKEKEFTQTVALNGKYSAFELSYRVRASADFKQKNEAISSFQGQMHGSPSNAPYRVGDRTVKKIGEWVTYKMRYECPGAKELRITFVVYPGSGELYFDDFVLTAK